MDSVGALNVFVKVAEQRSFVNAGRQLGVSASAVGKTVARLEERLGVRLLNRSTRSVALTAEGALFLDRCHRILEEVEAAQQELAATSRHPAGRLRISLPMLGEPFIEVLAAFQSRYRDVELDVDFTDRKVDVIEEGFDAVLRTGDVGDSRLTARFLGTFGMLLVGSPGYFREKGRLQVPGDLARHDCIRFRYPDTGRFQPWHLRGIDDADVKATTVCSSLEARTRFALHGVGIACLADFAVRDFIAQGLLESVLDDHVSAGNSFRILWPAGRHMTPKLRALIDHVAAALPLAR